MVKKAAELAVGQLSEVGNSSCEASKDLRGVPSGVKVSVGTTLATKCYGQYP